MIRKLISRVLLVSCIPISLALGEIIAEKVILAICLIGVGLAGGLMATEEQS